MINAVSTYLKINQTKETNLKEFGGIIKEKLSNQHAVIRRF